MRNSTTMRALSSSVLLLLAGCTSAWAQPAPIIRTNALEVGGFLGASYGVDQTRVMGGGNAVYSLPFTRIIMPYAEVSYFPGIERTLSVPGLPSATQTRSLPITDFNFGVHVRILIPKSRIIPYLVVGFGGVHSAATNAPVQIPDPLNPGQTITTMPVSIPAQTSYATSVGGGIRYYINERWGIRTEFKAYVPRGAFSDPFYRVTGGFFYQF